MSAALPYARVVIENGPGRGFDYCVPEALRDQVRPGVRVSVPFGSRMARGTVLELRDTAEHPEPRAIQSVSAQRDSTLSPNLLRLADWLTDYYCAPRSAVFRSMLPAPVRRADDHPGATRLFVVPLTADRPDPSDPSDPTDPSPPFAPPAPLTPRRRAVLEALRSLGGGWLNELTRTLGASPGLLQRLAADGWIRIEPRAFRRDPLANRTVLPSHPLPLMAEQTQVLEIVLAACAPDAADRRPMLLFGVTGSGKTEVYLQAIARVLDQARGAIVLVPEIALTPQTVQRFTARFGDTVAVLHSGLSRGDRQSAWRRIHDGVARVVVGPRSAVFAPVARLGLIVVDESHEPSYKQDEAPRYHARDVAVMRAHLEGCAVVLGTATPSLESWRNAQSGKYRLLRLTRRVDDRQMPHVRIVDMRGETARTGRMPVFSQALVEAINQRLIRSEQIMLFLNRRGFSASLICPACGFVDTCGDCSVSRTYHRHDERLRCHVCGGAATVPDRCPQCGEVAFRFAGVGTQRIEQIARTLFPRARIQRMDADVTSRQGSHEQILATFRAHQVDMLIGTQMIAKGLDFPNVTLVGVLMADLSLHMPDFRAGERTFQLLAQVAGRSGRGSTPGEVVVQTCTPRHRAVVAARDNAFEAFADAELADRQTLDYPPFLRMACLTLQGEDEAAVRNWTERMAAALRESPEARGLKCSDPVPAPLARAKKHYRYQILIRGPSARRIGAALRKVLDTTRPPSAIRVAVDIDALNMM